MKKILLGFLLSLLFIFSINAAPCPSAGTFNTNALIPVSGFQNRLVGYGANNRGCDGDTAIFFSDVQVKAAASLSNVDNTSDLNKPISTATQAALDAKLASALTQNHIFVGNASNLATDVAMSGDVSIISSGLTTIANSAVTNAKIANSTIDLTAKVTGILPNANTTATSANTASAIVSRNASGDTTVRNLIATGLISDTVDTTDLLAENSVTTPTIYGGSADDSILNLRPTSSTTPTSGSIIRMYTNNLLRFILNNDGEATFGVNVVSPYFATTGSSSGTISIRPQANAGTYNFNLPTTAGTTDYLLTSQGGGATAMTWTNATDANTASAVVKRDGSGNFSAGTITGNLSGTASLATASNNSSVSPTTTNSSYSVVLSANTGPALTPMLTASTITHNPSTGVLSATSFSGAGTGLTGTAASLTAGIASTISTANEASDTTTFPLFVTASGAQTLQPKNNTNFRYNTSSNLLSVNLTTIDNGGAALSTAINGLTFGDMGAGSYIGYGSTQFPRSTGVSNTGSLYHARNTFYNPVISNYSYGISGGGVTLLELADTAINFKYAPSGTVGNLVTFTTGLSLSQSTGITTARSLTVDNGGSALTGTTALINTPNTLGDGNYYNFGTSGRNMGVYTGGNLFLTANLDYNTTSNAYIYNSSAAASAIELGQTGGALRYAVSGTGGNTATVLDALTWNSSTGDVAAPNGNVSISTVGKGLQVKTGSNSRLITGTLSGGALAVPNTSLTANTQIFCYPQNPGGTPGFLRTTSRVNGSGFTVTSSSGSDTSAVACLLVEAI